MLGAFAAYAAVALDQQRLAAEAEAAKPIAAADKMRTALLAAVSHDLRTPLASAKAAVTSLRSADVNWAAEDHDELLATADESLDRLTHLVDNLLDMSRLQAGALSLFPRPAGLDEIVSRALDNLDPAARGITVDIPESLPEINVDPAMLERVIANLVENALRYSPPGRSPLLTASALGDQVELRVVDRGPGIPEKDRDRVFVPFQRLGDTDNTTGVGLGLALSRGLAEAMGGTLTAEDTPGGGLTMTVSVPVAAQPDYSLRARPPGTRSGGERAGGPVTRVLVVDDEPQLLRALRINLTAREYQVDVAATGAEALEVAARHLPDLVILDLGLPDMDGVDVIRRPARLDEGADHRAVRPGRQHGQGRGARRGRGRLRHQAVRRGGAAGPDARRGQAHRRRRGPAPDQARRPHRGPGRQAGHPAGRRCRPRPGGSRPADDIRLTPTEWHLLEVLLRNPGKLVSRNQLLTEVWGPGYADATGNLRLYMAQLRRKLEPDPARPR